RELRSRQAEYVEAARREDVLGEVGLFRLAGFETAVVKDLLHRAALGLLRLADDLAQPRASALDGFLVLVGAAQRLGDGRRQSGLEQRDDLAGRAALAPLALGNQRVRGAIQRRRPRLV